MTSRELQELHTQVGDAITGKDPRARRVGTVACNCGREVARAVVWVDGKHYLWIPTPRFREAGSARFVRAPAKIADLDTVESEHWSALTACRCGGGFIISCHGIPPRGYVYQRSAMDPDDSQVRAGDALTMWSLEGTTESGYLGDRFFVRSLGRATAATVRE